MMPRYPTRKASNQIDPMASASSGTACLTVTISRLRSELPTRRTVNSGRRLSRPRGAPTLVTFEGYCRSVLKWVPRALPVDLQPWSVFRPQLDGDLFAGQRGPDHHH